MNKGEIENKIKELQEQLKDIDKIDFSEFICRCDDILAIKGKKLLKSLPNGDMNYNNLYPTIYNDKVDYEVVNMSDLVKGDVFIHNYRICDFKLDDFEIFVGVSNDREYISQHLDYDGGIEYIKKYATPSNIKVKRFLRE